MTKRRLLYAYTVLATVLLAGCASKRESLFDDASLSFGDVIGKVNALSASIATYTAAGSVSIETPRMSQSAGFAISVKKPDSVLITIDGPFGITLGKALFTKEIFTAYNALNNTVYQGNPRHSMQSLPFFAGIDPEIIIDAVSGVRRFNNGFTSPDSFSGAGNTYRFVFIQSGKRTIVLVDKRVMRITSVQTFGENSGMIWEEHYTYSAVGDSIWQPESARIIVPERSVHLDFFFDEITLNPALPAFVLDYPDDADRITIN